MGWMLGGRPRILIRGASFLFIAEGSAGRRADGRHGRADCARFATLSLVPSARRPILRRTARRPPRSACCGSRFRSACFRSPSTCVVGAGRHAQRRDAAVRGPGREPARTAGRLAARRARSGGRFCRRILIALPGLAGLGEPRCASARGVLMILAALVSYAFAYSLARPLQQRNGALPVVWRALGWALVLTLPFGAPRRARALDGRLARIAGRARRAGNGRRLCGPRHRRRPPRRDAGLVEQLHHPGRVVAAGCPRPARAGERPVDCRRGRLSPGRVVDPTHPPSPRRLPTSLLKQVLRLQLHHFRSRSPRALQVFLPPSLRSPPAPKRPRNRSSARPTPSSADSATSPRIGSRG